MKLPKQDYEWFSPCAVREILTPIRGKPVPASIVRYWRKVLGITASTHPLTEGLYSKEDVQILAGGIIWMNSGRPLKVYRHLLDQGYRIADVVPEIQETLQLINITEIEEYATN